MRIFVGLRDCTKKTKAVCIDSNKETVQGLISRAIDTKKSSSYYSAWLRGRKLEKSAKLKSIFLSGDTVWISENRGDSGMLLGGSEDTLKNNYDSYYKRGEGGVLNSNEKPLLTSPTAQALAKVSPRAIDIMGKMSFKLREQTKDALSEAERKK